jgi:hypothetical protein
MNISAEPIRLAAAQMNATATPQAARSAVTDAGEVHSPEGTPIEQKTAQSLAGWQSYQYI